MSTGVRKFGVAAALLLVSSVMVYGTWLAADDMRAKPLVAQVTRQGNGVRIGNTGEYGWQGLTITVNGRYRQTVTTTVEPGDAVSVPVTALRSADGDPWPSLEPVREVAVAVIRRPRFPKVNRERTASGTFIIE